MEYPRLRARLRRRASVVGGVGLVALVAGVVLFALVPGELAERREYEAAPACPAGTTPGEADGCTASVPGTVRETERTSGRQPHYYIHVAVRGTGDARRIRMADGSIRSRPVFDAVRPGDQVTLTYWQGTIAAINFRGATEQTYDSPTDDWRLLLRFGFLLTPFGLMMVGMARWLSRQFIGTMLQPSARERSRLLSAAAPSTLLLGFVGILATLFAPGVSETFLIMALGLPVVAGVTWLVGRPGRRKHRRRDPGDLSGIVPRPPKGSRRLRAAVLGEVPYSVPGFDRLMVERQGRAAAIPKSGGPHLGRALPATLSVQGMRRFQAGDPEDWALIFGIDCVVIDCWDAGYGRPVRIVSARRDASQVLGALDAVATAAGTAGGAGGAAGGADAAGGAGWPAHR